MVCGVSSLSFPLPSLLFFFFVLVFGVVRAQPCEHARYPRTPLCSFSFYCLFLFSSSPRLSSRPVFSFVGMAVCVYHVSECSVGITAIGSLSRSSSFFW